MASTTWDQIYQYAKKAGAKFPECVSAQWALESAFGTKLTGKNNFFGIKGQPGTFKTTQEWDGGKFITIQDTFKDYSSPEACVADLVSKWYLDYKNYKGVNRAKTREECAQLLKQENYATDPDYPNKLVKLMNQYAKPAPSAPSSESYLERAAKFYKAEAHQIRAWRALEAKLSPDTLEAFKAAYSTSGAPQGGRPGGDFAPKPKFPLPVPYFYQRNSTTSHSERMCFSSAMAMAMEYLDAEAIQGDDDWYLRQVLKYGDTVSSTAQITAARSLGFTQATFHMDGSENDLVRLLEAGIPVPIGILHKGSISSPTGGGHWVCLIGVDDQFFYVHDPYGELDLINGGYPKRGPTDGKNQRYTRKNLMKRWLIHSKNDGWYVQLEPI